MRVRPVLLIILITAVGAGACGKSSTATTPTPTPQPSGSTVSIVAGAQTKGANAYSPNPISITKGGTVTWTNNDTTSHTSTSDAGSAMAWSSGSIAPGASFSQTFNASGTFTYHCTFHSGMVGAVTVQ
jgi:plastocyanin